MWIARNGIVASSGVKSTLNNGIISYWKADNNGNDELSLANLTAVNGATYNASGKRNQCFQLDGVNDYFSYGSDLIEPSGSFTFNIWFYSSSLATQTIICTTASNGYLGYRLYLGGSSTTVNFGKFPSGTTVNILSSAGGVYSYGAWNMATIVNDTSVGMLIYVNGSLVTSNAITSAISWGSTTINRIGINYNNDTPFNGYLDEAGVWSRALTSTEITELYNKFYPF